MTPRTVSMAVGGKSKLAGQLNSLLGATPGALGGMGRPMPRSRPQSMYAAPRGTASPGVVPAPRVKVVEDVSTGESKTDGAAFDGFDLPASPTSTLNVQASRDKRSASMSRAKRRPPSRRNFKIGGGGSGGGGVTPLSPKKELAEAVSPVSPGASAFPEADDSDDDSDDDVPPAEAVTAEATVESVAPATAAVGDDAAAPVAIEEADDESGAASKKKGGKEKKIQHKDPEEKARLKAEKEAEKTKAKVEKERLKAEKEAEKAKAKAEKKAKKDAKKKGPDPDDDYE